MYRIRPFSCLLSAPRTKNVHNRFRGLSFQRISDLRCDETSEQKARVKGWVKSLRKMKEQIFFDVADGSTARSLQVVLAKENAPSDLQYGCSVEVSGQVKQNHKLQMEIQASHVEVLGGCEMSDGFPFAPRKSYSSDFVRQFLHLRPRYQGFASLLRLRHAAVKAVHDYFDHRGYLNVHTPILTSNDCEGAGEVFTVEYETDKSRKKNDLFFNGKVFLTVSGQLHLEVAARCLNQVYCFGPTFRAENSKSRLHLSEFYMVEAETTYLKTVDELVHEVQSFVRSITQFLLDHSPEDIQICYDQLGDPSLKTDGSRVAESLLSPFTVLSYDDASSILSKNQDKLKTSFSKRTGFTKEHELFLVKHCENRPVFVVNWPKEIKPFYMKTCDNDGSKVMAFDLLCPNVGEICGGSFRENNLEIMKDKLERLKLKETLDWYLDLRRFGNVTTCGYGLGFERYLQVITSILNIKDVIPFPRWPHNCSL